MRQPYESAILLQVLLLVVVACSWTVQVTFAASSSGFHSLPLVPHHVQQRRRRLQEQQQQRRHLSLLDNSTSVLVERRSRVSHNRQLRAQQVGALYQGYGTHYIDLWCGSSPAQRQVSRKNNNN